MNKRLEITMRRFAYKHKRLNKRVLNFKRSLDEVTKILCGRKGKKK